MYEAHSWESARGVLALLSSEAQGERCLLFPVYSLSKQFISEMRGLSGQSTY